MCVYDPRRCALSDIKEKKQLTLLILDCWQREYDKRPYKNFDIHLLPFEERMDRRYRAVDDLLVIIKFLHTRTLESASFVAIRVPQCNDKIIQCFGNSLLNLKTIKLELMDLPPKFFIVLQENSKRMQVDYLSLYGSHLTVDDAAELRLFLIATPTLVYLNIGSCNIDNIKLSLIADGIHKCSTIKGYNCSRMTGDCGLTLDTMKVSYLVASLLWQDKLEKIVMRQCNFYPQDIAIMAEYIFRETLNLEHIDLAYNKLGADGIEIIFQSILNRGHLHFLNICGNGIGSHGGRVVVKYLTSSLRLKFLNISDNNIDAETVNDILTCMKKPLPLECLKIYPNEFDGKSIKILRRLLDSRTVPQSAIDITIRFDETVQDYVLLPIENKCMSKELNVSIN